MISGIGSPRHVFWRITDRCDLSCAHCALHLPPSQAEVLDTERMLRIADQLVGLRCGRVILSGGEPLLHADWRRLALRLLEGEVDVSLVSNGMSFGAGEARWCVEQGLSPVHFSVDGLEPTHDGLRRHPGSFQAVARAIGSAREQSLAVLVITTLVRANTGELEELAPLLSSWGVSQWQVRLARCEGELGEEDYLSPAELPGLVDRLVSLGQQVRRPELVANNSIGYYGPIESVLRGTRPTGWRGCGCGLTSMVIQPDGRVQACGNIPISEGNLREQPLQEIWQRSGGFAYARQFRVEDLGGACRQCSWADKCRGGCWALAERDGHGARENRFCLQHPATGGPRYPNTWWRRATGWFAG